MKEKNDIVKYHNDLNSITFYSFGAVDYDLFMSICSKMAEKGVEEIEISFNELRSISGFNPHWSESQFLKHLDSMNLKQLLSHGRIYDGRYIKRFVLFPELWIDNENKKLIVKANKDYLYILNDLRKNFTRFELQEFTTIEGKYAKILYRLLKQYRTTGLYRVNLEEFRRIFDVPTNYKNKQINTFILKPAVETLSKYFDNLKYTVLYEQKRGKPVKGYEFTFTPEEVARIATKTDAPGRKKPVNAFHNFEQRQDIDYDEIEKALLDRN